MVFRLIARTLVSYGVIGALLFLAAGTLRWPGAWIFLVQMVVLSILGGLWLARRDPGLLAERMSPTIQKAQPAADKVLLPLIMLAILGALALMALDAARFGWSSMRVWIQVAGELGVVGSSWLCFRTMTENSFAAAVVKVHAERRQTVVRTGPYRFVRHPMYAGGLLFLASTSLLLGSWWGLAAWPVLAVLLGLRIDVEERTLRAGLPDYAGYARQVRSRLIPGVW